MPPTDADFCSSAAAFALRLRELHHGPSGLVLPNAWDVMSALVIANEGRRGDRDYQRWRLMGSRPADGQHLDPDRAIQAVSAIVDAVDLPVSADIEGGYGRAPDEVAGVVEQIISVGACGINLEDSPGEDAPLLEPGAQAERSAAARAAASQSGVELVINARTDVFLVGGFPASLDEVLARAKQYAEADADSSSSAAPGLPRIMWKTRWGSPTRSCTQPASARAAWASTARTTSFRPATGQPGRVR